MKSQLCKIFDKLNLMLAVLNFGMVLCLLPFLPDTVPGHYAGGVPDRYGSKFEYLLFLLPVVVVWIVFSLKEYFTKKNNVEHWQKTQLSNRIQCAVFYLFWNILTLYFLVKAYNLVEHTPVNVFVVLSISIILLVALLWGVVTDTLYKIVKATVNCHTNVLKKLRINKIIETVLCLLWGIGLLVFNCLYSNGYINLIATLGGLVFYSVIEIVFIVYLRRLYTNFTNSVQVSAV